MTNLDILKRLYRSYTKKFMNKIFLALIFSIILAASTSSIAWLLDPAIKKIFVDKDQNLILIIPALIVIAFAFKAISLYMARVLMIRVGEDIRKIIQVDMMDNLIKSDTETIEKKHTGKFLTNLTNDVDQIINLISVAVLNLFKDSLTLIGLLSVMFYQNWKLSLIAIIMIPLATTAARSLGKRIGKITQEQMEAAGYLFSYLMEVFKNHKLMKIFQKEKYEKKRAEEAFEKLKEKIKKIKEVQLRASPIMEFLTGIMIAILIFYSGKLIIQDELDLNNFFSFLAAMMLAYQPVRSLATINLTIKQGIMGARRIIPIIDNKEKIVENPNLNEIKINKGNINFEKVYFEYNSDDKRVLDGINLNITGGAMTSLVGHSGAGKSTILNMIPRFYDTIKGDIKIDNQSIYKVRLSTLRENISLVSQETTLFDDTILNNIKYANLDATDKEIIEASKLSFADEFIQKLPQKYETIIGENGFRLSGGEKQRLSIARAILKKSKIILLDEATSSLDAETEKKIQGAINFLTKDRTTLVIAHRLSTILSSDKIYVVDKGKIEAEGTHEELLKNSKIYQNFYEKQLRNK